MVLLGCGRIAFDPQLDADGASASTSVQRAEYMMTVTPLEVPVLPVDPARSFVVCDYRTPSSEHSRMPMCELTGPTTVTISTGLPDPQLVVAVQVIELSGMVTVQRGRESFAPTELMRGVPIQPVQAERAFALVSRRAELARVDLDQELAVTARFADAATLELARANAATAAFDVAWQVVELGDASVQAGTTALLDGSRTTTATITPVDPANSFVVHTARGGTLHEEDTYTHAELLDAGTIHFERNSLTTMLDLSWFVVSLPGAAVQHGAFDPVNESTIARPITPVELDRTSVFVSTSGGRADDFDNVDSVVVTPTLDTATSVSFSRGDANDVRGTVSWFVVEWP